MTSTRTRILVEAALVIALSSALHFARLWQAPMGGTVSLDMLPIVVFALRRGPVPGFVAGGLFGVVDLLFEPYAYYPMQFLLDYPVAYALVAIAGLLRPLWRRTLQRGGSFASAWYIVLPAALMGALARFGAHWLSGVLFFASEAIKAGQAAWLYSLVYNGSYVVPAGIACGVAAAVVMPLLERVVPVADDD